MRDLEISEPELSRLADTALDMAKTYWASLEERPSYPATSGRETTELFARPWREEGRGAEVLQDFRPIADIAGPRPAGSSATSSGPASRSERWESCLRRRSTRMSRRGARRPRQRRSSAPWSAGWPRPSAARLYRQPVRRRLGGQPDGAGHGARSEAAGERDGRSGPASSTPPSRCTCRSPRRSRCSASAGTTCGSSRPTTPSGCGPMRSRRRSPPTAGRANTHRHRRHGRHVITGAIDPLQRYRRDRPAARTCGCMSTAPTAFRRHWPCPRNSRAWRWPIRCRSTRTNGSTSRSIAAACSTAIRRRRARPFRTATTMSRCSAEDPVEAFAFFEESFELSRRFRALKLWMSLQYHGRRAFREAILRDLAHAQLLAETIRLQPSWSCWRRCR